MARAGTCEDVCDFWVQLGAVSEEEGREEGASRWVRVTLQALEPSLAHLLDRLAQPRRESRRAKSEQAICGGDEGGRREPRSRGHRAFDRATPAMGAQDTHLFTLHE